MKAGYKTFPEQIRIENTTACNAMCTICPREKLSRPIGTMSFKDFCTIIDQCDPLLLKDLHLQGFGEPLVEKGFADKIRYARKKLPKTRLFFVTNASLLKDKLAKDIILSGVDKIKISFYGVNSQDYENIHKPLKFKEIKQNILDFAQMKKKLGSKKPKLSVKYIGSIPQFIRFAFQWAGKAYVEFSHFHNYGQGRNYRIQKKNKKPLCPMVSRPIMQILWNGDVVPCCYDFNGEYVIGNVFKNGVKEIWQSTSYNSLRKLNKDHKITSIPICKRCDKIR